MQANNDVPEGEKTTDIKVESPEIWQLKDGFSCMGVQYYQGEPVMITGSRSASGINVYMEKKDGTSECLFRNLSKEGSYQLHSGVLDEEGNLYVVKPGSVIRINKDGKVAYEILCETEFDALIKDFCLLSDGRLILAYSESSSGTRKFRVMDAETGELEEKEMIFSLPKSKAESYLMTACGDKLWMIEKSGVYELNEETGNLKLVMSFKGSSYTFEASYIEVATSKYMKNRIGETKLLEDGTIEILWKEKRGEIAVMESLQLAMVEDKERLVLRALSIGDSSLRDLVAEFNRTNDKYHIVIEECSQGMDRADFINKTKIQLATGKGADVVYGNDMRDVVWDLIQQGVYEDLTPYIEASGINKSLYFNTVFDNWKINDKVYGICLNRNAELFAMSAEVLNGAAAPTTVEDFVDVLLAYNGNNRLYGQMTSKEVLRWLLEGSENLWGMVDWNAGSCDFSDELFTKMLQVAKRYGYNARNNNEPLLIDITAVNRYYYMSEAQREAANMVLAGPFGDEGIQPKTNDYQTLTISAAGDNKEAAWEFIELVLRSEAKAPDIQKTAFWDAMDEEIAYHTAQFKDKRPEKYVEPPTTETRAEMDNWMNETIAYPLRTEAILSIICEEAEDYFNGMKSEMDVKVVIVNRVRLYLEEHK